MLSNAQHSPFLNIDRSVSCIICPKIARLSRFIAHARSIERMMLGTNILETKLIAIIFKVSYPYVWLGSFHSNHAISYINYFVFSELDLVCLKMTDE